MKIVVAKFILEETNYMLYNIWVDLSELIEIINISNSNLKWVNMII